jgi:hypothetical protein
MADNDKPVNAADDEKAKSPLEFASPIIIIPHDIDMSRSPYKTNINYMAELPDANSDDSSNDEPVVVVTRNRNQRREQMMARMKKPKERDRSISPVRLPVVAPVRLPVVAPVRQPVVAPVRQPVVAPVAFNPADITEKMFWETIDSFRWANATDERLNLPSKRDAVNLLHASRKEAIKQFYKNKSEILLAFIQNVLDKKNIFAPDSINIVLSHIIALGENWYNIICDEPDMTEFLIDNNECQNFYYCISNILL